MKNQILALHLNADPGGMGHDTDEGTDSEHEGTGPFNERGPLKVIMATTLMSIYKGELPIMSFDGGKSIAEENEDELTTGDNAVCDEIHDDDRPLPPPPASN